MPSQTRLGDAVTLAFVCGAAAWVLLLNSLLFPAAYDRAAINIWFDSDVGRVVENMTVRETGHAAAFKHPIFPIVAFPPTKLLTLLGASRDAALAIVLALNASAFVWLLDRLARRLGLASLDRALLLLACLGSAGFMFWFPVPETFPFGATTMLAALLLVTTRGDGSPAPAEGRLAATWRWAAATALAMSMTITNILMALAGALDAIRGRWRAEGRRDVPKVLRTVLTGGVAGVLVVALVAVAQDRIFGEAGLFFNPNALLGERQFIGGEAASSLLARLQTLGAQVMVAGAPAAPSRIGIGEDGVALAGLRLDGRWPAGPLGLAALAGWCVVVAIAAWRLLASLPRPATRPEGGSASGTPAVTSTALLFLAANGTLHLVYGSAVFLYLAHFVGPAVLVAAGTALQGGATGARIGVALLAVLSLAANLGTFTTSNALAQETFVAAARVPGDG